MKKCVFISRRYGVRVHIFTYVLLKPMNIDQNSPERWFFPCVEAFGMSVLKIIKTYVNVYKFKRVLYRFCFAKIKENGGESFPRF